MVRRQPFNVRSLADVDDLIELVRADRVDVLVVDTLNKALAGANENDSADMGAAIAACDEIRRQTGAALILLAHNGKDAGKGLRGPFLPVCGAR